MFLRRLGVVLALVALVSASLAAPATVPPTGTDLAWDIIRRSTEALSTQANQSAREPDGGAPIRNLYEAYATFKARPALTFRDCATINGILRKDGAEAGHVEDHGGGQLRRQNVGFYKNGQKVIDFPDWETLPEKAKHLDKLLARVSSAKMSRDEAIEAATEAHLIIGKQQLFSDGNHRTARVISDWILMRQGLPPANHSALPRDSYEVELRVSLKGAREVFRQHFQKAVAASEAAGVAGGRAPPPAGAARVEPKRTNSFGRTDWTQDSPELESPSAGKPWGNLSMQQHMRVAIGEGGIYFLDRDGEVWLSAGGRASKFCAQRGAVAIDCLGDRVIMLQKNGQLAFVQRGQVVNLLPDRFVVSFQVSAKERLYAVVHGGLVLEYDGQKWRSLARVDDAAMAAIDQKSLFFVMSRKGNVFRRVDQQWQMVDDGTGSRQIEASNGQLYVLKEDGHVWRSGDFLRAPRWERIDDGTGTRQIAIDEDDVYVLKQDGRLWKLTADTRSWSPLSPEGSRIAAMRVKAGVAVGLTESGAIVGLQDAPRRSATRKALFDQLMPE